MSQMKIVMMIREVKSTSVFFTSMFKLLEVLLCVSEFLCLVSYLVFYVPETECGASDRVKASIRRHGGICTEFHESCTIQIKPNVKLDFKSYYPGKIIHEAGLS